MEYKYEIQCRVEALAHIAMTSNHETSCFLSDAILFSHWDMGPFRDNNFWLAKAIITAKNKNDAITCFNTKMARLISQIAFVSQCYIEFACQPFLVKRVEEDFAFVRDVCKDEGVGLMFGEEESKASEILLKNKGHL